MTISDAEETAADDDNKAVMLGTDQKEKGKTFRKRRLSLTNLRQLGSDSENEDDNTENSLLNEKPVLNSEEQQQHDGDDDDKIEPVDAYDEKAHSFRKRRLSLTSHNSETTSSVASANDEQPDSSPSSLKRRRKASDASASSLGSTNTVSISNLKSNTLHSAELLAQPPSSPTSTNNSATLPKLYQQAAPPQQLPLINDDESKHKTPKWKKRHIRQHADDDRSLPFPRDIVGTYSCHGVEPIYDNGDFFQPLEDEQGTVKLTMAAKTNQDRGGVAFPYGNSSRTALFAVYDGTCLPTLLIMLTIQYNILATLA
jgi:hypothetical protein